MNPILTAARGAACAVLLCIGAVAAQAQQRPPNLETLPEVPPPPRMAPQDSRNDNLEPQVTIKQQDGNRVEEYRVRGRLYAVRVTPPVGRPYLLVDRTGKGVMTRMDDIAGGGVTPPQWTLFEF